MADKEKVKILHEKLNDVLMNLHAIQVWDERGREAKQEAIITLVAMRRTMESMGLHHAPVVGGRHEK